MIDADKHPTGCYGTKVVVGTEPAPAKAGGSSLSVKRIKWSQTQRNNQQTDTHKGMSLRNTDN
ncbi:MAG: hypothetical protein V1749_00065, partial [Candidatus Desantisbacteria bacterium]